MRRCVFEWLRLGGKEYEYVSLSQDTAHEDLRQRRELRSNSSIFMDQAAVNAAIHGRILVLEGIERVERNILPLLNNLLENREITLEDGRILLPPHRSKFLENHNVDKDKIISVHEDFRVIGIMRLNNSSSSSTQLDPPFRSRFQARYIPPLSASSIIGISRSIAPKINENIPQLINNFAKVADSFSNFSNGMKNNKNNIIINY